jgi:hypothetical protein
MAKLAGLGVTAIDEIVLPVTVKVAAPLTLPDVAVMVDEPWATAVASPAALMVAVAVVALDQVTVEVMLVVELSLYVAVAVNCCVAPTPMLGVAGVTAMLANVFMGAVTVSTAVPLTLLRVAVILLAPAATPVASPAELMVAAAVLELVHVTDEVMFAVEPSL